MANIVVFGGAKTLLQNFSSVPFYPNEASIRCNFLETPGILIVRKTMERDLPSCMLSSFLLRSPTLSRSTQLSWMSKCTRRSFLSSHYCKLWLPQFPPTLHPVTFQRYDLRTPESLPMTNKDSTATKHFQITLEIVLFSNSETFYKKRKKKLFYSILKTIISNLDCIYNERKLKNYWILEKFWNCSFFFFQAVVQNIILQFMEKNFWAKDKMECYIILLIILRTKNRKSYRHYNMAIFNIFS